MNEMKMTNLADMPKRDFELAVRATWGMNWDIMDDFYNFLHR